MNTPPSPIFISHSFNDSLMTVQVEACLSKSARTVIFPIVSNLPPNDTISARLLESIRGCRSLIWIDTENGRNSRWVTMERDYARRAGLQVIRFDAGVKRLQPDTTPLLTLRAFAFNTREDDGIVQTVVGLMKERYVDTFYYVDDLKPGVSWQEQMDEELTTRLEGGGYCLAFWSRNAWRSRYFTSELEAAAAAFPGRILPVCLNGTPLPDPLARRQAVEVFGAWGDLDLRLVDNLIAWIYWLVQQGRERHAGAADPIG